MIRKIVFPLLFTCFTCQAADTTPRIVDVGLLRGYIPTGFDSNDNTQIVVLGTFPDTCYKVGASQVRVDSSRKVIEIRQSAYYYSGVCLPILDPFEQVINLGILESGDYTVQDALSHRNLGGLRISQATKAEADDYLYAPISDAHAQYDKAARLSRVSLSGAFTDRCTRYKHTLVQYYKDVIVIQPIAERLVPEERDCSPMRTRFSISVPLRKGLKGTYLIHVRSMNGQSVNRLFEMD